MIASDKIEILQLETRGRVLEQEVLKRFQTHLRQLEEHLDVPDLLPHLQKHHVLSQEEAEELAGGGLEQHQQNQMLLELVESKPAFWVVKFSECLRESSKHKKLAELLLPSSSECV